MCEKTGAQRLNKFFKLLTYKYDKARILLLASLTPKTVVLLLSPIFSSTVGGKELLLELWVLRILLCSLVPSLLCVSDSQCSVKLY